MPKTIMCSNCGRILEPRLKAIKEAHRIVYLIDPHECGEVVEIEQTVDKEGEIIYEERDTPDFVEGEPNNDRLAKAFASLKTQTVKKSYDLESLPSAPADQRDPKHLRQELKSSAPVGILSHVQTMANSTPEGDISQEPVG